jgi:hypothetical protein
MSCNQKARKIIYLSMQLGQYVNISCRKDTSADVAVSIVRLPFTDLVNIARIAWLKFPKRKTFNARRKIAPNQA